MPKDKTESHKKVLAAAREEFMTYGFEKASMRRIGERCGMTAAGLYRHCRDKADLFRELVEPSVERIDQWIDTHAERSIRAMESDEVDLFKDSEIDMMRDLIYPNMEEYRLLLTRSQGSPYENFLHDLAERHQSQMLDFLPLLYEKGYVTQRINAKELHLLLSAYITAMFEPVIHGYTQEEAYRCLDMVETFFLPGWKQLMGF
ncbi:MAG: TetR/AcrR family transcriptional regulator [Blautia sp.]|nr:TetR/AcrR family transcriptional regulator [Blautia sp.]